jgi:predicted amidohydrolase
MTSTNSTSSKSILTPSSTADRFSVIEGIVVQIAAIQLQIIEDELPVDRLRRVTEIVRNESDAGADFVVLPEMWLAGFFGFDHYADLAEDLNGPLVKNLAALAAECGTYLCAGSIIERDGRDLYNSTVLFGPDGTLVASYRKMHLFGYGSREREILSPGQEVVTCELNGVRFGLSTCYDLRFPELYRRQVEMGAEVLLVVAAWPFPRLDAWRCLVRARAIENQAVVVACNAAGTQKGSVFAGATRAYGPWGMLLGELDDRPGVLRCDLDINTVSAARAEFPALADRVMG